MFSLPIGDRGLRRRGRTESRPPRIFTLRRGHHHPPLNFRMLFWRRFFGRCRRSCMWRWLCSCWSRRFRCSGLRRSCWCSSLRRGFRMRSSLSGLSCSFRSRRGSWCGLRRRLRMSSGWFIWRGMSRCRGLISQWRRSSRPRGRLCCGSRMSNIRLRPRGGFGRHGAMLQLRDVCSRPRHRGMGGNSMIRRSKIGLILFRNLLAAVGPGSQEDETGWRRPAVAVSVSRPLHSDHR